MDFVIKSLPGQYVPVLLFLVSGAIFLASLDFESTGDTIVYANLIETGRLDQFTLHQGYIVLGSAFAALLGAILGLPTDQSLAVMSALFGAGALVVAYELLRIYLGSARDALVGAIVLAVSYRFFCNATSAEIYVVQSFFLWSSFLLFEKRRFYSAGVMVFMAMWVTPLTLFFLLWFPVAAWLRGYGLASLVRTASIAMLLYIPFLSLFYREMFWGTRGLLVVDEIVKASPATAIRQFVVYQFKHYTFLNLMLLPALWALPRHKALLLLTLATGLPNFYVLSNLSFEDNVFILAMDVFFVLWIMIGWQRLRATPVAWVPALMLLFQLALLVYPERLLFKIASPHYGDAYRAVGRLLQVHERPLLFVDWTRQNAFIYYNRAEPEYPMENGYWYEMTYDTGRLEQVEPGDFASRDAVYVLESWSPSSRASVFLSDEKLASVGARMSDRRQVERFLGVACDPVKSHGLQLYRCR